MKITLVSLDPELYCLGIRVLSACLRQAGHDVRCIFLPPRASKTEKVRKFKVEHSPGLLDQVRSLCLNSDLIGISLMTNQFIQAVTITNHLKAQGVGGPIVWGGIQPTVEPEACLEHADIVCLGEGEDALVELVNRMVNQRPYSDIKNLWFKSKDGIIRNALRPLLQNLDVVPFPDYSCKDDFVRVGDHVEKLTKEKLVEYQGERIRAAEQGINYPIMAGRGCLFACTYCCNSVYRRLYPDQKQLRWRSTDRVIEELEMVQKEIAPLACVYFVDDDITAQSSEKLRAFGEKFQKAIGVPFFAQVSPLTITEEKMETLLSAGCTKIVMGVETASERVAGIYNRDRSHRANPAAISLIEKFRPRMKLPPTYQFIIDNPYESLDETVQTLRFAANLPKPWDNPIYSLMLFPGTPLYEKAQSDGLIKDKYSEIYGKDWNDHSKPFFKLWIRLYRANAPRPLLHLLLARWIVRMLSSRLADSLWRTRFLRWLWDK